ncbi:MAG: ATP-dependent endonuclease [Sphaerochaeta sp.]
MKISQIRLGNFRKLNNITVDMEDTTTLLVGANNSGKTSFMEALRKFFEYSSFVFEDFSLSNIENFDQIGNIWIENSISPPIRKTFIKICPYMDIWLDVDDSQIRYIVNLLPTLDYSHKGVGVRMIFQPNSLESLKNSFLEEYTKARDIEISYGGEDKPEIIRPNSLSEYINENLISKFRVQTYLLDPKKGKEIDIESTDFDSLILETNPLKKLLKIDMINAQRGLSDSDSKMDSSVSNDNKTRLSNQFIKYYNKHLKNQDIISQDEFNILKDMQGAKSTLDDSLKTKFSKPLQELENVGYPGIANPKILLTAKIDEGAALKHDSALKYMVMKKEQENLYLPEQFNGLGFQNLISMVFKLIEFREDWINNKKSDDEIDFIEPIHLVLLEEPEAHLHVQVQTVFVEQAYSILTKNTNLGDDSNFKTQLIISTHSSSIVSASCLNSLRYFKRCNSTDSRLPISNIVNISGILNKTDKEDGSNLDKLATRFMQKYLQSSKTDIFFADAVIVVEGSAENILLPYFIQNHFKYLNRMYITTLLIDGRHFQKIKPLFDNLDIPVLLITDIDTASKVGHHKAVCPCRDNDLISSNFMITKFFDTDKYDDLLNKELTEKSKSFNHSSVKNFHIAYQIPVNNNYYKESKDFEFLPSTFEDSLIYSNFSALSNCHIESSRKSLIQEVNSLILSTDINEIQNKVYKLIKKCYSSKTEFALDLMYEIDPENLVVPNYITEGLNWLEDRLKENKGINND